ncbi:MAG: hypothetical protein ACOCVF_01995 [bacterium]
MEIEFTVKIKKENKPPTFHKELGEGVLQKITFSFKEATEKDLKDPIFIKELLEIANELKENWIEVKYKKI